MCVRVRARARECVWIKSVLIVDDGCVTIMAADKSVLLMTVRPYRRIDDVSGAAMAVDKVHMGLDGLLSVAVDEVHIGLDDSCVAVAVDEGHKA